MQLKPIQCTNCGAAIDPGNVSQELLVARCGHCRSVFSIETPRPDEPRKPLRPRVSLPAGFAVEESVSGLEIRRSWYSHMVWFLLGFCIFWNTFMVVWHGIALSTGFWPMSLFGLLHTAVGIGLAYGVAATFLNTTTIRVAHGRLDVSHAPLPWTGAVSLDADDISQLYCKQHVSHTKNGATTSYEVHAVQRDGYSRPLLKGLQHPDQALFVEQELERHLGIEDEQVRGELAS